MTSAYAAMAQDGGVLEERPCQHDPQETHYLYVSENGGVKTTCSCLDVCNDKVDFADDFLCVDCSVDTSSRRGICEYYMVDAMVWWEAKAPCCGMLCIGCLETRLGYELEKEHFTDAPINTGYFPQSERLQERLSR